MKGSYCCVHFQSFSFRKHLNSKLSFLFLCKADPIGSETPLLPVCCKVEDVPATPHLLLALPCTLSLSSLPSSIGAPTSFRQAPSDRSCVLQFLVSKQHFLHLKLKHTHDLLLQHPSGKNLKKCLISSYDRATSWNPMPFARMPPISTLTCCGKVIWILFQVFKGHLILVDISLQALNEDVLQDMLWTFYHHCKSSCASYLQLERDSSTPSPAGWGAGLDAGSAHTHCFSARAVACQLGWSVQFALNCPGLCLVGAAAVVHKQSVLGISQASQPCRFLPLFPKEYCDLL